MRAEALPLLVTEASRSAEPKIDNHLAEFDHLVFAVSTRGSVHMERTCIEMTKGVADQRAISTFTGTERTAEGRLAFQQHCRCFL
jgi:hypothetical protein